MSKTPISMLQEMMVKQGITPNYKLIHDGGGRHENTFTYQVTCDGLSVNGTGRCKKDAKHEAAKAMLTEIAAHRNYPQLPAASAPTVSPPKSPLHSTPLPPKTASAAFFNAVGELRELCAANNLQEPEYLLIRDVGPPHARIFTIRCKVSNFDEDGTATTKKQAKHDAAKRMVDKIKSLENNSNDLNRERNETDSSNLFVTTIDEEMNENVAERYRELAKVPKQNNLGIKMSEYHTSWRDSLEIDERNKILEQLNCIFPNEFFDNELTPEIIMEKISELRTVLLEVDVMITMRDVTTNDQSVMTSIELNTTPLITQLGTGRNKFEASKNALSQIIMSIKLLLS